MKMLDVISFLESVGNMGRCSLTMSTYYNHNYECSCGKVHNFSYTDKVLAQGAWKLVLICPNNQLCITCVKLKSKFLGIGFSGFESMSGLKLKDEEENVLFIATVQAAIMMGMR